MLESCVFGSPPLCQELYGEVYRHSLNECLQLPRLRVVLLFFPWRGEKKMEVQEWITCPNSCSCLRVSLGSGLVQIFRNNFLSSLCYLLGKNLPFQVGSGGRKMEERNDKKRGRKEWRRGGGREANPHCRPQRQTRQQNSGGLSLGIPYNEPQGFSPGSCSPKHQVHPSGV